MIQLKTSSMKKLTEEAAATATRAAHTTKPPRASDIENLFVKTIAKADAAEESVEALHIRVSQLESCVAGLASAEKVAPTEVSTEVVACFLLGRS